MIAYLQSKQHNSLIEQRILLIDVFYCIVKEILVYMQILKRLSYKYFFSSNQLPLTFMSSVQQNKNENKQTTSTAAQHFVKKPKDQIALLLKTRYALSAQQKPEKQKGGKQKGKEEEAVNEVKFEVKAPKGTRDFYPDQMAIRRKVIDTIVNVFKKHGAVELDTPVFELKDVLTGKYGEDSKLIYDLEDQGGEKCSLRYDLTVPFARFMANNTNIQKIKRFHIGKVYRRDQPTISKGRYREFYQCDFDIAGKYDAMIPDSEVLAIMQEILQALEVPDFLVKVNHRKILEALVAEAGCPAELFKPICSSIDKLDKQPWSEVQAELQTKGVSLQQCKIMERITSLRGDPWKVLEQIKSGKYFAKEAGNLKETIVEMEKLFTYLGAMKRLDKISFDQSLARGLDYYTGMIYEIVLTDKTTELGSISGGGRYDNLIGMFCQHQIPATGGSLGIERLFTILESKFKNKVKQNECQILVGTIGKIPVETKMGILSELWGGNIKAETMYLERAKPDKQFNYAFDNEIPLILWLAEDELKAGEVKVKILYKREEHTIKRDNLLENIRPFVEGFRQDFLAGKVSFEDPTKKEKK